MKETYDFSGWATRNDLRCSDGRIIKHNAFRDNDGKTVPLVWNHRHNEPEGEMITVIRFIWFTPVKPHLLKEITRP